MHSVSESIKILNTRFISATLRFRNGFRVADAGEYACIVLDKSTSQARVIKLEYTVAAVLAEQFECKSGATISFFQIRILNTSCKMWDKSIRQFTEANLMDIVISALFNSSRCGDCSSNSTTELVITNQTACSTLVKKAVVYRGTITSATPLQANFLLCELEKWQRTGPIVHLTNEQLLYQVDRECTFKSESLTTSECSFQISSTSSALLGFSSGAILFLLIVIISAIAGTVGSQIHKR